MLVLKRSSILGYKAYALRKWVLGYWATSEERGNNRISRPKIMRHEKHPDPSSSGTKWTYVVIVVFFVSRSVGLKKEMLTKWINKSKRVGCKNIFLASEIATCRLTLDGYSKMSLWGWFRCQSHFNTFTKRIKYKRKGSRQWINISVLSFFMCLRNWIASFALLQRNIGAVKLNIFVHQVH